MIFRVFAETNARIDVALIYETSRGSDHDERIDSNRPERFSSMPRNRSADRAAALSRRGLRRRCAAARAGRRAARGPRRELAASLDGSRRRLDATPNRRPSREQPGTVIGPYKLLQQIGEGGMGVVFMAEQTEPVQRTVALKIIKPGMDTRQVIARFEAERQALAMMDHPNIAKVLDAGTTDSGPAVLRDGAGQGHADHQVLRRPSRHASRTAGTVLAGLSGGTACPPKGHHPPRSEAVERDDRALRRPPGAQDHRFRRGEGDRLASSPNGRCSPSSARSWARWST